MILLALLFSWSPRVHAGDWDYSAGLGARTFPFGASAFGELGFDQLLWGKSGEGEYKYGYLRPSVKLRSSGVVNRAEASIDLAPISFLTLTGGYGSSSRGTDTATLDCMAVACRGSVSTSRLGFSWVVGGGAWAAGGSSFYRSLRPSIDGQDFADEMTALTGAAGGDEQFSHDLFVAHEMAPQWNVGFASSTDRFLKSGSVNHLQAFFARNKSQSWTTTVGIGVYDSSTRNTGFTFFGELRWTGIPALGFR